MKKEITESNVIKRSCDRRWILRRKWLILLASFYGICCSGGFHPSISVLFVEFLDEFQTTKAETSLVQSVCSAVILCTGIISGSIVKKYGEQKCMIVGGIVSSTGLALSYFANGIPFLVAIIGIISGFGFSMCYVSCYTVTPKYFSGRRRLLVLAFISLGSGVGASVFPILFQILIKIYAWRGTMLIVSGINLNLLVCALICKSNPDTSFAVKEEETRSKEQESENSEATFTTLLRDLITNKAYIGYAVSVWIISPSMNIIIIYFIDFFEFHGMTRADGVWLLTCMNLANVLFRPIPGLVAQVPHIPKLAILTTVTFVSSINFVLFPFAESHSHYLALVIVFGMCIGGMTSVLSLSAYDIVGAEKFSIALGIQMSGCGILTVIAGPIAGHIRDVTGSYDYAFYCGSGALFLSFIILFITVLTSRKSQ